MKKQLLAFLILAVFFGCSKESKTDKQSPKSREISQKSLYDLAKNLSSDIQKQNHDIKNRMIRAYAKTHVEEFLLAELIDNPINGSLNTRNIDNYNVLAQSNPELTISFPAYSALSETLESHISSIDYVVILDDNSDVESSEIINLNAYDANGNFVTISSEFNENLNYAVVKNSEAYTAVLDNSNITIDGESVSLQVQNFTPYLEVYNWNLYSNADINNAEFIDMGIYAGNPPNPPNSPTGGLLNCDRDPRNRKDELHKIKFDGNYVERTYESRWRQPIIETVATYAIFRGGTSGSNALLVQKPAHQHRDNVHGKYCAPLLLDIATWTSEMGDKWQVAWVEVDDRKKATLKFNLGFETNLNKTTSAKASVEYTIEFKEGDKLMGSNLVEFCEPAINEGTEYKVCDVNNQGFWFRQHIRNN